MKRAVITGATGAIGRALIQQCISEGYEVLCIVHRSSRRADELKSLDHCQVLFLDLPEYENALSAMKEQNIEARQYDVFFHLAWMAPFGEQRNDLSLQLDNVKAAVAAVQLAKNLGCATFVGTGSQAEYGRTNTPLAPDTPTFPETGYGIAKLCAGQLTRLACEQLGIKHIWMRVLSVYGPYDRDQTLISTAIRKMLRGEETAFSPCEQMWDYIYSEDAATLILYAGERGKNGRIYMVGSGEEHLLKEYIQMIAEKTGYQQELGFGKLSYNDKQVMHLLADMDSTKRDLGFSDYTEFHDGIQKTIEWYRAQMTDDGLMMA